jgi:hypothetical protein
VPITVGPGAALNDAGKLWLMTRSVFRRRCPNADSRKKKRLSLMQTNVTLYALLASIQSGTENAGLTSGKGNVTFCVRWKKCRTRGSRKYCRSRWQPSCHVWPEPGRQFAIHSLGPRFTTIGRLVSSLPDALELTEMHRETNLVRVDQDRFVPGPAKAVALFGWFHKRARTLR